MWQHWNDDSTSKGNVADSTNKYFESSSSGQQDSGIVDSGFLSSGGNLVSSTDLSEEIEEGGCRVDSGEQEQKNLRRSIVGGGASSTIHGGNNNNNNNNNSSGSSSSSSSKNKSISSGHNEAVAPEPMRVDSGVDLGLSESLSQLSLKHVTLNPLDGGKVQAEPTLELKPITGNLQDSRNRRNNNEETQQQQQRQHSLPFQQRKPELWELNYTQDDYGDTRLHILIMLGVVENVFNLIRMAPHPCLLDIQNDDGLAPLHLAVRFREPKIVRRLILAGAGPDLRDAQGNTALHLACATGDLACAEALTNPLTTIEWNYLANAKRIPKLRPYVEQQNYDGETSLHVAASAGHVDLVRLLVELGADLEAREGLCGRTALHLAIERGRRSVVMFLLQECKPCLDAQTYAGITAYQIAILQDSQLARELVRLGATPEPLPESDSDLSDDPDDKNASYMPPLARLKHGDGVRA